MPDIVNKILIATLYLSPMRLGMATKETIFWDFPTLNLTTEVKIEVTFSF